MMENRDWYECGQKIGDIVNHAVDSKNFQELNKSISDTINDALDSMQKSMMQQKNFAKQGQEAVRNKTSWSDSTKGLYQQRMGVGVNGRLGRSVKGTMQMLLGGAAAGLFGIFTIAMLIALPYDPGLLWFPTVIMAALCAGCIYLARKGNKNRKLGEKAQRYLDEMQGRDVITVEELAAATGSTVKEVRADLKKMISSGVLSGDAFLDEQATTFMTSREAYKQYQAAMKAYEQRRKEAQAAAKQKSDASAPKTAAAPSKAELSAARDKAEKNMVMSEETRKILQEGNDFIAHIREANVIIEDETVSGKLDRLEHVVTRIFEQVAARPDSAPDLHRMMNYYLPITRKLVDAYIELDKQQIGGENITRTREEIVSSLDTINDALEVFLDSFFRDTAWDVEADIATLRTMIARDGLAENDFKTYGSHTKGAAKDLTNSAQPGQSFGGGAAAAAPDPDSQKEG